MKTKYVMFDNNSFVVFHETAGLQHAAMGLMTKLPIVSAGFVNWLDSDIALAHGMSMSLGIKSRIQDSDIISTAMAGSHFRLVELEGDVVIAISDDCDIEFPKSKLVETCIHALRERVFRTDIE